MDKLFAGGQPSWWRINPERSMKRVHYFQHVPFETLGSIETWMHDRGYALSVTRLFDQRFRWPSLADVDWLVVMGGPMNVDEEHLHAWLREEKKMIARAVHSGKVVLGICLGAQLIASALGAAVRPNGHKEIGWMPVRLSPMVRRHPLFEGFPERWSTFHWHGDTFDLPAGAVPLASSDACPNQGFILGDRVVGLQFHLEMTASAVRGLVEHCAAELIQDRYIQGRDQILDETAPYAHNQRLMARLLDQLAVLAP